MRKLEYKETLDHYEYDSMEVEFDENGIMTIKVYDRIDMSIDDFYRIEDAVSRYNKLKETMEND